MIYKNYIGPKMYQSCDLNFQDIILYKSLKQTYYQFINFPRNLTKNIYLIWILQNLTLINVYRCANKKLFIFFIEAKTKNKK